MCPYGEPQAIGGALRRLHDDVHPEVESVPQRRVFHRLLLEPLDQLQVLHHRPQVPGGEAHGGGRPKEDSPRLLQSLFVVKKTWMNTSAAGNVLPDGRLEFKQLLGSLSGFGDVVGQHAHGEELAHVPIVIHLLQGTFAPQQTVQPHTWDTENNYNSHLDNVSLINSYKLNLNFLKVSGSSYLFSSVPWSSQTVGQQL